MLTRARHGAELTVGGMVLLTTSVWSVRAMLRGYCTVADLRSVEAEAQPFVNAGREWCCGEVLAEGVHVDWRGRG